MGDFLSDNPTNFGDEDDPDSPVSSSKSTPPPPSSAKVSPPPPSTPPRSTPPPPKETNSPPPPSKPNPPLSHTPPPKDTNTPPQESDTPPEDINTPPKDNNPPPNPPPKENDPPPKGSETLSPPPPPRSTNPTPPEVATPISAKPPPKASPSGGSRPEDQPSSTPSDSTPASHPKQLPSSSSSSSSTSKPSKDSPSKDSSSSSSGIIIGLIIGGVLVVLIAVCFVIIIRRRRRRLDALDYRPSTSIVMDDNYYRQTQQLGGSARSDYNLAQGHSGVMGGSNRYGYHSGQMDPNAHNGSKSWFSYEELADVTDGFCRENMIGEGGFGCVYKGTLLDGRRVAVKQLKAGSGQGEREFRAEVDIISRVHHRHLVSLVGYCIAEYHRLLVYEFLPNNTLEHHLHGKNTLDWSKRMRIAIGSAKGLAYLHEDCHPKIIHRDIKSANILLEDSFEPQVADFGLAKLSNDTHTHVSTRVMGTFGYMAPEYASSGKLTDRSDVFSFGVVLLEMITGRKPVDSTRPIGDESLVEWARPLLVHALETGNCDELVDPRLQGNYNKIEMFTMIEVAAACVRHSAPKRPRMVQVVRSLDCQDEMQDLTNGVKYGQSQAFNSGQYSADIQKFRRMAFDDGDSYEFDSGEYDRRIAASDEFRKQHQQNSALKPAAANQYFGEYPGEYPSDESDTRAMFRSERSSGRGYS